MTWPQEVEEEPEARKIARQKRLAQKAAAIEAARQEMHSRDNAIEQEKAQKVQLLPLQCIFGEEQCLPRKEVLKGSWDFG